MIKIGFDGIRNCRIVRGHGKSGSNLSPQELTAEIITIRQGTTILVESDNARVQPHRGKYYLLFAEEINTAYLFYLDVSNVLRYVFVGKIANAAEGIYGNVANGQELTILKSDAKRAYRVALRKGEGFEVIKAQYKNRSSAKIDVVYMSLFDAINYATSNYSETGKHFVVITKDDNVLFEV